MGDMSVIADRYRRLAADMTATIAAVDPARWESPSPCEGWTARDVVRHLVETHGLFLGFVGRALAPSVDDAPYTGWVAARDQVQADLDDPARATEKFEGFFGPTAWEDAIDRFICFDLVIHRWDLARAAGLDETIQAREIPRIWADTEAFGAEMRRGNVCGPALEPPAGADEATRLLAFLGRRA
jgi:uncharacterized protein (TIGR03086 family)